MSRAQRAEQFRRALQLFAGTLTDEAAMEIATVYPSFVVNHSYSVGDIFSYGKNGVGDPQLYKVLQAHISQEGWNPDEVPAIYKAIGIGDDGYPIWSRPTGAADAYNIGDVVNYKGVLYRSVINGNVWSPEEYPAGWEIFNE